VLIAAVPNEAADASSPTCNPHGAPKATVIVLLGGGFVVPGWGDTSICRALARRGYRAINLVYPLHNLPGALRTTTRAVRRARRSKVPVFAFGLSAGGTLAEIAAVTGKVDAAVAVAAPADLLRWSPGGPQAHQQWDSPAAYWRDVGATRAQRRAASPLRQITKRAAPLLLFHSTQDEVVPFAQSRALANKLRRVRRAPLRRLKGKHLQSQGYKRPAFRWLASRVRP
jgi:fermentation-respiration switch protein FrsA (DUF1100 family)